MADAGRTLAVLGAGKAAEALIASDLLRLARAGEIVATARHQERLDDLAARHGSGRRSRTPRPSRAPGSSSSASSRRTSRGCLLDIGGSLTPEQTVVSIVAAIPTAALIERHLDAEVPVVRAMPNTPMTVHEGMAGICPGAHAGEEHLARAEEVLERRARRARRRAYMDAITAVSGSGPAYFALLAESMIEAGILLGLSREISTDLVVHDAGDGEAPPGRGHAPGRAARGGHLAGRNDDRAIRELEQAGVRAAFLNDPGGDGALGRAGRRRRCDGPHRRRDDNGERPRREYRGAHARGEEVLDGLAGERIAGLARQIPANRRCGREECGVDQEGVGDHDDDGADLVANQRPDCDAEQRAVCGGGDRSGCERSKVGARRGDVDAARGEDRDAGPEREGHAGDGEEDASLAAASFAARTTRRRGWTVQRRANRPVAKLARDGDQAERREENGTAAPRAQERELLVFLRQLGERGRDPSTKTPSSVRPVAASSRRPTDRVVRVSGARSGAGAITKLAPR